MDVTGVILAGGQSRRLGRDKAGLLLGGKPLGLWVAEALAPLVDECLVVTNQPLLHFDLGLPLASDLIPGLGALGGIATGLFFATTPLVLAAPCDTPFVQTALLREMILRAQARKVEAVVCESERGLEPLPAVFHRRLLPRVEGLLTAGERRVRRILEESRTVRLSPADLQRLDPEGRSFFNLNTPMDLEQARRLARTPGL
jgi:molybdopterin-guanine dinucleotide biosynthesis protein A